MGCPLVLFRYDYFVSAANQLGISNENPEENCEKCTKEKEGKSAGKPGKINGFEKTNPGDGFFGGRTKFPPGGRANIPCILHQKMI